MRLKGRGIRPGAEVGVRRNRGRLQALVRVAGKLRCKSFPIDTPLEVLQAWRDEMRTLHSD
jgi:hypothetical protein